MRSIYRVTVEKTIKAHTQNPKTAMAELVYIGTDIDEARVAYFGSELADESNTEKPPGLVRKTVMSVIEPSWDEENEKPIQPDVITRIHPTGEAYGS